MEEYRDYDGIQMVELSELCEILDFGPHKNTDIDMYLTSLIDSTKHVFDLMAPIRKRKCRPNLKRHPPSEGLKDLYHKAHELYRKYKSTNIPTIAEELKSVKKEIEKQAKKEIQEKIKSLLKTRNIWNIVHREFGIHFKGQRGAFNADWVNVDELNEFYVKNSFPNNVENPLTPCPNEIQYIQREVVYFSLKR